MSTSKISKLTRDLQAATTFGKEVGVSYAKKPADENKAGTALDDVAEWSSDLRDKCKETKQAANAVATSMTSAKAYMNDRGMKDAKEMAQNAANAWIATKRDVDKALKKAGLKV